ncbi:hypothetical protein O3M35_003016 [Rhynocoris fuscipes]|uniref:Uncharacterized protein n=1 Tax=Rhynocoris fuscipes TaxID=488301 RepID=A0AAW1CLK3_9HEMI
MRRLYQNFKSIRPTVLLTELLKVAKFLCPTYPNNGFSHPKNFLYSILILLKLDFY